MVDENDGQNSIDSIKGIGPFFKKKFRVVGIKTLKNLVEYALKVNNKKNLAHCLHLILQNKRPNRCTVPEYGSRKGQKYHIERINKIAFNGVSEKLRELAKLLKRSRHNYRRLNYTIPRRNSPSTAFLRNSIIPENMTNRRRSEEQKTCACYLRKNCKAGCTTTRRGRCEPPPKNSRATGFVGSRNILAQYVDGKHKAPLRVGQRVTRRTDAKPVSLTYAKSFKI